MPEEKYDICIEMDTVAKDVPGRYLMVLVNALLSEYYLEDNISVLIKKSKSCD